ncbi:hypothetical protein [Rubrivivax gelatinosus]|uniref:Uncharacterized protein n=1 Tax=Rubrivivax gelatinosus TaxID=28068 RepID=A0A4R2M1V0_RUBGE|nr:hypothetical protein [Rubrivivax gelatinosus]MBK1688756.1 hypothetical protein [Rubrivivax gelatinosus]TCO98076.1 hypothetical protein EV684_11850 [Rubrivivax gelatinosus]
MHHAVPFVARRPRVLPLAVLLTALLSAMAAPARAAPNDPAAGDAAHLQGLVSQLDALDRAELLDLLDQADCCTLARDFDCAEARHRRARLYAHQQRDRAWVAKSKAFLEEERELQASEEKRREREAQRQALEDECARFCPVPVEYHQCVAGQRYVGNCTDGSPTPSLADGMREGFASAMAGAQRLNNIHNQAMNRLQDTQAEQRRAVAREEEAQLIRRNQQAALARERQSQSPAQTPAAAPARAEAQRYTFLWPGSLSSDPMHASEADARAEVARLAERASRGETEPTKIQRGLIPDAVSYEWVKTGPTQCRSSPSGAKVFWWCWAETEYRVVSLAPRPSGGNDASPKVPAAGVAR